MPSRLSLAERDRRWHALSRACSEAGYAAFLFAANDYRGHKGPLRYIGDFNLYHRFGYAGLVPGVEPALFLPLILNDVEHSAWISGSRFVLHPITAVIEWLRPLGEARVGIVGLKQIMRAGDYLELANALPGITFEDATPLFEQVRLIKSEEEFAGLQEAADIADTCFERLLDIARPGVTERAIGAQMLAACADAGGEDPLFLTMNATAPDGAQRFFLSPPRDRILDADAPLTFSFEMIGPMGYWVEMCRMITFGAADDHTAPAIDAGLAAMAAGHAAMQAGSTTTAIQEAAEQAVDSERYIVSGWSGHSIGHDVIEWPVIASAAEAPGGPLQGDTAFAFHPLLTARAGNAMFYMADTYRVGASGADALSRWPTAAYTLDR